MARLKRQFRVKQKGNRTDYLDKREQEEKSRREEKRESRHQTGDRKPKRKIAERNEKDRIA